MEQVTIISSFSSFSVLLFLRSSVHMKFGGDAERMTI